MQQSESDHLSSDQSRVFDQDLAGRLLLLFLCIFTRGREHQMELQRSSSSSSQ